MELQWPTGPGWAALASAVEPGIALAARVLSLPDRLVVVPAGQGAVVERTDATTVAVSPALVEGPLFVGEDADLAEHAPPGVALDRFRRVTGGVLEAALVGPDADPWARAAAARAVDDALPALGWLVPAAWGLVAEPHRSALAAPRRLAWWLRFAESKALPAAPTPAAWARFGAWVRDRVAGPAAQVPVQLDRVNAQPWDAPWPEGPWCHAPRRVDRVRRAVVVSGAAAHPPGLQRPGEVVVGVAQDAVSPRLAPAGPVGTWVLASGHFGSQVGAARGVEITLSADGSAVLVGADAFVGPATASVLQMADQIGVSGVSNGRWEVVELGEHAGTCAIRIQGFRATDGTVHPRSGHGFALPAAQWLQPVQAFLDLLAQQDLQVQQSTGDSGVDSLRVEAQVNGVSLQLRLVRAGG